MKLQDIIEGEFGRAALQRKFERETEKNTGETLAQRRQRYKDNIKATKERMAQHKKDFPEMDEDGFGRAALQRKFERETEITRKNDPRTVRKSNVD